MKQERILTIRLGALGDLVLCFQAFHEIRAAHPGAGTALLTMPAFAGFAKQMPWFDHVLIDARAPAWRPDQWMKLLVDIYDFSPTRVYDLQGKFRQSVLYALLGGPLWKKGWGPEWSGAAPLCSHPRLWPPKPGMHYTDFVAAQLRKAGVPAQPPADLSWLDDPLKGFDLPPRFVALIPGCAKGREYKRWPAASYAEIAKSLEARGIATVAVGAKDDAGAIAEIRSAAPHVADFSGRTNLLQLAGLFRRALGVVGNDTGPTHIAAAVGTPTLALISAQVDPAWSAPKGPRAKWLQGKPLEDLPPAKVLLALDTLIDNKN